MGCFMGGEGTVKIDWSRYNSILCKLGFDGSFRELICSHGFEPTFECESLVGLYLPYEKHPYGTEDLLSDLGKSDIFLMSPLARTGGEFPTNPTAL